MRLHTALAALLLLAAPGARAAERLVLLPATGANVDEGELSAATDLLRANLERTKRFEVELGRAPGGNVPEATPAEAGEEAREAGATLAVTLRISRLGSASSARLAAYRPDGTVSHSDALSAANADDLEPVLQRLAEGLASSRPAASLATIDTVTEREARPPRRIPAAKNVGLRLGTSSFLDRPGGGSSQLTGVGVFWLYDARSYLAEATIDWHAGEGDGLFELGLGVYYPFSRRNVTPYVGGGLGYVAVNIDEETKSGLGARGAAGLLLGRLSTLQVRLEAGWRTTLFTLRVNGESKAVQGPFATAGIAF